ncbi:TauD/TfdA family dioxygenase [Streptomyces sp. DG2A-72]|uniref:TauD/TfdA family dioxygenase n=1 Tax=Streptomyces sp. DG2A-72 TaxID=3051386 RepID=UPI00265BB879|nr:TauD/TfdA family dioxygenase [Streptomyces sp. DG2A-72]MDO0939102.1 TauD/TfdA family dioxygenase [Streptomyces sp. DG2A-72]
MLTSRRPSLGVVPARIDIGHGQEARRKLAHDGAVVLTGLEATADAPVVAAAAVLGQRLRQVFPLRQRQSQDGNPVHLHADSFDIVVDMGGVPHRRRDPDEDYVLIQCVQPPGSGGDSFLADAYRFVDDCTATDPDLWEFLTQADVDLYGAWGGLRGLPATPRVGRHVEYTRTGRRIVRRTDGAAPLHRDPDAEHIQTMLARFQETVRDMEGTLPRFRLAQGEILILDNYRCWHGREAHTGDRIVRILTLRSSDAR